MQNKYECDPPQENINMIANPPHYNSLNAYCECGKQIECITITREMGFSIGNIIKYLWRLEYKGNKLEDAKKAQWYLNDYIKQLECRDV